MNISKRYGCKQQTRPHPAEVSHGIIPLKSEFAPSNVRPRRRCLLREGFAPKMMQERCMGRMVLREGDPQMLVRIRLGGGFRVWGLGSGFRSRTRGAACGWSWRGAAA